MTSKERLLAKLNQLADEGVLLKSQCSRSLIDLLRPLTTAGVICEERVGSGRRLRVKNVESLQAFIFKRFPDDESFENVTRVAGVHRFRDTKVFLNDNPDIINVRAWKPGALQKHGNPLEAELVTEKHGVFSFRIDPAYTLHGFCALVENPVVFRLFEHLSLNAGIVIYGQGRVSKRFLNWLSTQPPDSFWLLHLPDYDPVGLNEFERLRRALGARVRLHIPSDIEDLFSKYSNAALVKKTKSRELLAVLRKSESNEVRTIVELINLHNAGLEQEALLPLRGKIN